MLVWLFYILAVDIFGLFKLLAEDISCWFGCFTYWRWTFFDLFGCFSYLRGTFLAGLVVLHTGGGHFGCFSYWQRTFL